MLGSMYSGVSGMKVHQTKLNVIGNNIANVNTYGFKASRATFRDVYYQTVKGGNAGSNTAGGSNPSQVGYGAQLGSIDLLMNRTSFQMTDRAMDLAIDGEGFFQVQDAAGNQFYTRSGQLNFDSAGNLVDAQGNFVLGVSGNPLGKAPGSGLIQLQLPQVPPAAGATSNIINSKTFNITGSNNTKDSNVSFRFNVDSSLADQELVKAQVGTNGISITVNPTAKFANMAAFSNAVNQAITDYTMAQTGKPHPGGDFTITCDPATAFPAGGLTGKEICSDDFGTQYGSIKGWPTVSVFSGIKPTGVSGTDFGKDFATIPGVGGGAPTMTYTAADATATPPTHAYWEMSMIMGTRTYTGRIEDTEAGKNSGKFFLKNNDPAASDKDYIEMKRPSFSALTDQYKSENGDKAPVQGSTIAPPVLTSATAWTTDLSISATTLSSNLGLSAEVFMLAGGTAGGPQGIENLTGIVIGNDGVITAQHTLLGDITVGRVDLVTFANAEGLRASGGTYFTTSPNSGKMSRSQPGQDGSGPLVGGSLEMSNVDLSREFSDMITTQRGFQANTRIITVSDEILNELVNLKR